MLDHANLVGDEVTIVMADDDDDDRMLTREALRDSHLLNRFDEVADGQELMDYLRRRGAYANLAGTPLPGLILLDLNMPRKDGREALKEIKLDPDLRRIPVVILTTSKLEQDVAQTYDLGVNSFIVKPVSISDLAETMSAFSQYWLKIVQLPVAHG